MIQRIQTVYLFIGSVLMIILLFTPLIISTDGKILEAFTYKFLQQEQTVSKTVFPLGLIALLSGILNFISIFFYKNNKQRVIQVRFASLSMLLAVGFYIALYFYAYVGGFFDNDNAYSWTLIFPLIVAILNFMAVRAIKKDIEKIKSADRLR